MQTQLRALTALRDSYQADIARMGIYTAPEILSGHTLLVDKVEALRTAVEEADHVQTIMFWKDL